MCYNQGCTDAAPEAPHPRPTRCDAATREGRRWLRVGPRLPRGFFFFFSDSRRCGWDSARYALIYADLGHIGRNRRNGWFKPKRPIQAEIQTLFLTPSLVSLLCALCGVRVLGFPESLSASLSLLSVSASPQQPNTNATFLPGLPGWLKASPKKKKKKHKCYSVGPWVAI